MNGLISIFPDEIDNQSLFWNSWLAFRFEMCFSVQPTSSCLSQICVKTNKQKMGLESRMLTRVVLLFLFAVSFLYPNYCCISMKAEVLKRRMLILYFQIQFQRSQSVYSSCVTIWRSSYFGAWGWFWVSLLYPVKNFLCVRHWEMGKWKVSSFIFPMLSNCHHSQRRRLWSVAQPLHFLLN